MKTLKSYVLTSALGMAMSLASSGVSATFAETLSDLFLASTDQAAACQYNALALGSPGISSLKYYTYVYANKTYLGLYKAWVDAPAGSNTKLSAQYAFQNALKARNHALAGNYGYNYGTTIASEQMSVALYVALTNFNAANGI